MSAPCCARALFRLSKQGRLFKSFQNRKGLYSHFCYAIVPRNVLAGHQQKLQPYCLRTIVTTCQLRETSAVSPNNTSTELSEGELHEAVEYLKSDDYKERYQDKPVWANYRRNFKGQVPPSKTRKQCIRGSGDDRKVASNACPICRDENLKIDYRNVELLEQFVCSHTWQIYSFIVTGVCQKQYKKLVKAIEKARSYGLMPFEVQKIHYNYDDYYKDTNGNVHSQAS
ncbi:28S ribosomal protein S18b, mitochondrial [Holothuria leucospilota]|uniref:Small ribosomal subunit protein mS40 n=1 Tax=Holothuria leucospilota TaxID=206669 RepID=A0A9Q1C7S6_HOLLE|nr:28S ribosomal protein S18b, mitochondrial [Holothuria leucospilota]